MTDELLPCPFCGSPDVHVCGVSNGAYVECRACRTEGPFGDFSDQQAMDAWNSRPAPPAGEVA